MLVHIYVVVQRRIFCGLADGQAFDIIEQILDKVSTEDKQGGYLMKLSGFCAPFYSTTKSKCSIKGKMSQPSITEFFVKTALGDFTKIELIFSDDLFCEWFNGKRELKLKRQFRERLVSD